MKFLVDVNLSPAWAAFLCLAVFSSEAEGSNLVGCWTAAQSTVCQFPSRVQTGTKGVQLCFGQRGRISGARVNCLDAHELNVTKYSLSGDAIEIQDEEYTTQDEPVQSCRFVLLKADELRLSGCDLEGTYRRECIKPAENEHSVRCPE